MSDPAILPADPSADIDVHTAAVLCNAGLVDLLDVRERDEWAAGHIAGATVVPDPATVLAKDPTWTTADLPQVTGSK